MMSIYRPDLDAGEVFVNFNQNNTSLAVATKTGYSLYSLGSVDVTLDKIYHMSLEEILIIERLFESSLVAIVQSRSPRKLKVCHFKKQSEICNYSYTNSILAVKLNRERLVVCLEESLYIHNIQDMKVIHTIRDTPTNSSGICALSVSSEHCYLAYPGCVITGKVQIFDTTLLQAKATIPAHDSPLAALAFSPSGTELATASERGTVIRVFSSLDGSRFFELRRGLKRCVTIASLSFSTCAEYLVCSSNTETVHIFRLDRSGTEGGSDARQTSDDWMGYLSKTVSSYLPTQVTDVFSQERPFTSVTLPESGIRRVCAITEIQKQLRLLIASQDGYLYVYSVPSVEGLECQLIKKHDLRLDDSYAMDIRINPPAGNLSTNNSNNVTVTGATGASASANANASAGNSASSAAATIATNAVAATVTAATVTTTISGNDDPVKSANLSNTYATALKGEASNVIS